MSERIVTIDNLDVTACTGPSWLGHDRRMYQLTTFSGYVQVTFDQLERTYFAVTDHRSETNLLPERE